MSRHTPGILVINPGSTSTKTALYQGKTAVFKQNIEYVHDEAASGSDSVISQVDCRTDQILNLMKTEKCRLDDLDAIAARGGPLRPVPGGVYRINRKMLEDAGSSEFTKHVSKIACLIADYLGRDRNIPCFTVDPVSTDEYDEISRISGLKECPRKSLTHALNMKAAARMYAEQTGRAYETCRLVTAHLGGGISIAAHAGGRMIDSVDANGEGPFSPERSGGLRVDSLSDLLSGNRLDPAEARNMLAGNGGLVSHFGTSNAMEIEKKAGAGDSNARLIYEAMAYSISKSIAALSAVLHGKVEAILLTGGLARSKLLTGWIEERVVFIAPVRLYPGEFEMEALRDGVMRALSGETEIRVYPTGDCE